MSNTVKKTAETDCGVFSPFKTVSGFRALRDDVFQIRFSVNTAVCMYLFRNQVLHGFSAVQGKIV